MSDDLVKRLHTTAESLEEWVQKYTGIKKKNTEAKLMLEAADRIEALEARIAKADALLRITKGALGDIADGEPEWPDDPAKELEWCRSRALAAYREGSDT